MSNIDLSLSLSSIFLISALSINILLIFIVLRNSFRSATNIIFAILNFITSLWLVVIYISFNPSFLSTSLFWIRLSIFLAVPQSILFFLLAYNIPNPNLKIKRGILGLVFSLAALVMILTISPYVFTGVEIVGNRPQPIPGPGMVIFAPFVILFSLAAAYVLIRRIRRSSGVEKQQLSFVAFGIFAMLGLIILTILIGAAIFRKNVFVAFAPLYTLIFLGMTAYAVIKHHLFNIKVIATEALTVIIWITLLSRVAVSDSLPELAINLFIFLGTIIFGVLLIKGVRTEVRQREQLQVLNVKLNKANAELESLSRFKTQLLSLASHQVKSPLAAIKGFVTLVMDGTYGPVSEKIKEVMQKVKRSSDTLINLVNSLLDLRKVEEGKMEYQFNKVGLREMVNSVVENLQPLAKEKKLELTFTGPNTEVSVNADGPKLQQVIQNLVDNAIKYTPAGFVKVELKEEQAGSVLFSVVDSGLGISKKLLPHLFEEFVRDERVKQEIRGTGLGLYIAKKIVEAHQGELWAESDGEGKGSRFFVRLKRV